MIMEHNKIEYSIDILNHFYYYLDLISLYSTKNFIEKNVVDLGSGLRVFLNIIHNITKAKVYFIDIPENLILADSFSRYFSPNAKVYYYGNKNDFNENYDMYFFPFYAINEIPKNIISLFINTYSLPEMNFVSSQYYLKQIYNLLKKEGKIFSINRYHDYTNKNSSFKMSGMKKIIKK